MQPQITTGEHGSVFIRGFIFVQFMQTKILAKVAKGSTATRGANPERFLLRYLKLLYSLVVFTDNLKNLWRRKTGTFCSFRFCFSWRQEEDSISFESRF